MTLRPSDAHLWVNCALAGQMLASGAYPATHDPEADTGQTDAQREGICAHWVAECMMMGAGDMVGEVHANGWVVDTEMVAHVTGYVEYVRSFGKPSAVEQTIDLFNLIRGRLDTVVSDYSDPVIRVFDLKYGWKLVHAEQNYAMLCYALWVWTKFTNGQRIELHIYQPRPNHPDGIARVWTIQPDEVLPLAQWLNHKAEECFVRPVGAPGEHCLKCPARGPCHALNANVFAAYDLISDDRMSDHTPAELAAYLTFLWRAVDLVTAKCNGIEAEVTARIRQGKMIPGWALEPRHGNRKFTSPRDRIRLATGIDPVKTVEMSPAELERAGAPKEVVNALSTRPMIGKKLTNNPENLANRLFGKPEGKQ